MKFEVNVVHVIIVVAVLVTVLVGWHVSHQLALKIKADQQAAAAYLKD